MRLAVVAGALLMIWSCNNVTSLNGTQEPIVIHTPKVRTVFFYSAVLRATNGNNFTELYQDTVKSVDSLLSSLQVFLQSQSTINPELTINNNWLLYSNAVLLKRIFSSFEDPPFLLPISTGSYLLMKDTAITSSGFFLSNGTYLERADLIDSARATIAGNDYSQWHYRSVHDIWDTVGSPAIDADTAELFFSPDLGYFTSMQETRYFQNAGGIDIYQMRLTLDSVHAP